MSDRVPVLFIGASGRSGSTLVERVLGQIPGFFDVGELRFIWERGLLGNQLCGCGRAFDSCGFWNDVGEEAYGGFHKVDVDEVLALKRSVDRLRYIPRHVLAAEFGFNNTGLAERVERYGAILERLYRAIQNVSGAKVIVESSKPVPYAFLLNTLPFMDLRLIRLQRDSRAVAYSWARRKPRSEIRDRLVLLPQAGPLAVSWKLTQNSALLTLASRMVAHSSLLKYEDFVHDPTVWTAKVLTELDLGTADDLAFVRGRRLTLTASHTVAGNPMRFQVGDVEVRPDEEWKVKMRVVDRAIVTALTLPLLYSYGYLGGEKRQ
jgi:hypothetical protein